MTWWHESGGKIWIPPPGSSTLIIHFHVLIHILWYLTVHQITQRSTCSLMVNPSIFRCTMLISWKVWWSIRPFAFSERHVWEVCKVLIKLEVVPKQRLSSYSDDYCCAFDPETNNSKDLQRSHLSTKVGKYFQLYYSWLKLLLVGLSRVVRCAPRIYQMHTTDTCTHTHHISVHHAYISDLPSLSSSFFILGDDKETIHC